MDITKCANDGCALKETCVRWLAIPEKVQSYSRFEVESLDYSCYISVWVGVE